MKNDQDQSIRSVADLKRLYPTFCAQIAHDAAREERQRLKQLYKDTPGSEGERLLLQAVIRANSARRARSQ